MTGTASSSVLAMLCALTPCVRTAEPWLGGRDSRVGSKIMHDSRHSAGRRLPPGISIVQRAGMANVECFASHERVRVGGGTHVSASSISVSSSASVSCGIIICGTSLFKALSRSSSLPSSSHCCRVLSVLLHVHVVGVHVTYKKAAKYCL